MAQGGARIFFATLIKGSLSMRLFLVLIAAFASAQMVAAPAMAGEREAAQMAKRHSPEHAEFHKLMHPLFKALDNPNRAEDSARDRFRHPAQTLAFFDVRPDMKIGEYAPGGGWYSRVLANYLGEKGKLVGLFFDPTLTPFDEDRRKRTREAAAGFAQKMAQFSGKPEAQFAGYTLDAIPQGETASFDRILLIRMLHNLMRWNMADSEIKRMRALLKPGGLLGIVQHRAKPLAPYAYADGNHGYLRQDDVIKFIEAHGFELVGMSEINANPADSADHPRGVWEMPPVWGTKREELKNLGESDRMTLLFRKVP